MIFGIGVDIVQINRIQKAMDKRGEKFVKKVLSEEEYKEFLINKSSANFLAKRFAAKEAFSKALGSGFTDGLTLKQIQIVHNDKGRPLFHLTDVAKEKIEQLNIRQCHLSLSDERKYVVAFVTLEGRVRH
ncbi:MAG: holo-ACP synthase [Gammaproteobacteria bacterium]